MGMFDKLLANLKASRKTIVFTEGTDARILSAASRLLAEKLMGVVLCGEPEAVKKAAADGGFDITGAEIIDPMNYDGMDENDIVEANISLFIFTTLFAMSGMKISDFSKLGIEIIPNFIYNTITQ